MSKFSSVKTASPNKPLVLSYSPIAEAKKLGVAHAVTANNFIGVTTTDYQYPPTILVAFDSYASGAPAAAQILGYLRVTSWIRFLDKQG